MKETATTTTMGDRLFAACLLLLLSVFGSNNNYCRVDAFFVAPDRVAAGTIRSLRSGSTCGAKNNYAPSQQQRATSVLGDASVAVDAAAATAATAFDSVAIAGGSAAAFVAVAFALAPLLWAATRSDDDDDGYVDGSTADDRVAGGEEQEITIQKSGLSPSRFLLSPDTGKTRRRNVGAVDRRDTLATLVRGAVTFAASDVLLGAATGVLGGESAALSSSVYGARWNGLYRRIAALAAKHEAAAAVSPDLISWIARSPAAFANPELRAWVAAQRAFAKSRQVAAAAAALEEGLTAAGAVAAAAFATKKEPGTKGDASNDDYNAVEPTTTVSAATRSQEETLPPNSISTTNVRTNAATETAEDLTSATTTTAPSNLTSSSVVEEDTSKEKEE